MSAIKLNNIKYWIKTAKTLAFRGCHVVSLCFKPRMISKTRKKPLNQKTKQKYITTKKPLMFTKQVIQHVIWSRQKDHGFPIASRSVPVNFSLGPRSSLVRYSLVYRRPIENRTRNKRKTNERATNVGRETIENSTRSHYHGWLMAGSWQAHDRQSSLQQPQTRKMPFSQICRGKPLHFLSHTEHFLGE